MEEGSIRAASDSPPEVYTAVKQNRGRLPGLNDVYAQMSQFFKRARKAVKAVRSIETAA